MLVLNRNVGESINVNGPSKITIIKLQGKRVRVGVEAAKDVKILRSELEPQPPNESSSRGAA